MRTTGPAKITASLPDDIKTALTILVSFAASVAVYKMTGHELSSSDVMTLIWSAGGLSLCYSLVFHLFSRFAGGKTSVLAIAALALLLAFLLWDGNTALPVYILWAAVRLCPERFHSEALLCAASSAVMVFMWCFDTQGLADPAFTWKFVFAALIVLLISHLAGLIGYKDEGRYPFAFFIVLLLCLIIIPERSDPINWKPLINAGKRAVEKTKEIGWSISYRFSDVFTGDSYSTGYSSFDQNGDTIRSSERTELVIKTLDNTTFTYRSEGSGQNIMRRRTVYLAGSKTADHGRLLDFLFAMYSRGVDHDSADLFARKANLDIRYAYLKTEDEILPSCPVKITDEKGNPVPEKSGEYHKKGYRILTDYIDIDYGSPYLEKLITEKPEQLSKKSVSFDEMSEYALDTFAVRLKGAVSEEEYASWQQSDESYSEYLDTDGATDRMRELASEITEGCAGDYDKCRAVEDYLRQYRYRTDTGTNGGGSTGSAKGMSRIADGFMFDSGQGYCVHFASSMVMLLRLSGIPARLDGGYRYTFPFDRQEEYEIRASEAHVWPEAYVSGFGWIGFEPTSGMSTARERTWHREPAYGKASTQKPAVPYIPDNIKTESERTEDMGPADGSMSSLMKAVRIVIITVASVIATAVLLIAGVLLYRAVRYKRADENDRLKMDVDDITGVIRSIAKEDVADRGVLSDYDPYIPEKYRDAVKKAFDVYYRIKYSGNADRVTQQEAEDIRDLRDAMRREYRRIRY